MYSPLFIMQSKQIIFNITTCFFLVVLILFSGCQQQDWQPQYGKDYIVTVTKVIDGDTVHIILPNGNQGTLRFLGIDCPETTASQNNIGEYHNINNLSCLAFYGKKATSFISSLIDKTDIIITFDSLAGLKDTYNRWLATPKLPNGTNINSLLLKKGYARAYTEGICNQQSLYTNLQQDACQLKKGLWSCNSSKNQNLYIQTVHYNAAGNDNENLNDEYVIISYQTNTSKKALNLSGYYLKDASENTFVFPSMATILPNESIIIYTGNGNRTETEFYWNSNKPIWGNEKDTATFFDKTGNPVDFYQWPKDQ